MTKNCTKNLAIITLKTNSKDIFYITWIIDASDGLGFVKTDDINSCTISIETPISMKHYVLDLIEKLQVEEHLDIEIIKTVVIE